MAADKSYRPDVRTSAELARLLERQTAEDPVALDNSQRFPTQRVLNLDDADDRRRRRALRQAGL
jgi:hypothetical protein